MAAGQEGNLKTEIWWSNNLAVEVIWCTRVRIFLNIVTLSPQRVYIVKLCNPIILHERASTRKVIYVQESYVDILWMTWLTTSIESNQDEVDQRPNCPTTLLQSPSCVICMHLHRLQHLTEMTMGRVLSQNIQQTLSWIKLMSLYISSWHGSFGKGSCPNICI